MVNICTGEVNLEVGKLVLGKQGVSKLSCTQKDVFVVDEEFSSKKSISRLRTEQYKKHKYRQNYDLEK